MKDTDIGEGKLLVVKGIDPVLAQDFKAYCAKRGKTQKEIIIELMQDVIPDKEKSVKEYRNM